MRRVVAVVVLLAALPVTGVAVARDQDWADDPAGAHDPAYAASRALCRGLKGVVPPAGDAPTGADAAALADCSSEALYDGIGQPSDPRRARLCAFVEKRDADPQVTDFGFTGDRVLMMLYANGLGTARDLDLATALACRAGGTPAEIDGRVRHLARLKAEHWAGTDFSLCDDAASGSMRGVCADHRQLVARAARQRAFAALSAGWTPAQRAAYAPLARAEAAFADARGQDEADPTGRGAAVTVVVEAEDRQERAFAALLAEAEAGRLAPVGAADALAADAALNAAYDATMRPFPPLAEGSTRRAAGIAATQRAWLRYRGAWLAFAKLRYPSLSADTLTTRLARDRSAQLAAVPAAE